jgi:hypothetical protein
MIAAFKHLYKPIRTGLSVCQLSLFLIRKDLLHPSYLAVFQPHFDTARMEWGGCKDILHDPNCPFTGALVFFKNNFDALSGSNIAALLTVHCTLSSVAADCLLARGSFSCLPYFAVTLIWRHSPEGGVAKGRLRSFFQY